MGTASRIFLRRLHLWLGLILGLPFLVIALTGSALVFYIEIDALLNPKIHAETALPAAGWDSPVWDQALTTARGKYLNTGTWSFEVTGKPGAIPARYYAHAGHHDDAFMMIWLAPDGTRVLRAGTWGDTLMTFVYDVHMTLLAGDTGNYVVGWLGAVTLFLLITGIAVWWPRGTWRKALSYKPNAAPTRRLYDLHKLFGIWSLLLLLILSGTGALLGLPAEKNWLFSKVIAPVVPIPAPRSTVTPGEPITVLKALTAAHRALPDARLAWIDVPSPGQGVFRIRAQVPSDPTHRFPQSYVFVDQYSGEVLALHDARAGTASSTASTWIRPLHDASIGGVGTRILGVVIGLVPGVLFVTGFLRWRRRASSIRQGRVST